VTPEECVEIKKERDIYFKRFGDMDAEINLLKLQINKLKRKLKEG
jgi:hypothetical protein